MKGHERIEELVLTVAAKWLTRIPGTRTTEIMAAIRTALEGVPFNPHDSSSMRRIRHIAESACRTLQSVALATGRKFTAGADVHGVPRAPASPTVPASTVPAPRPAAAPPAPPVRPAPPVQSQAGSAAKPAESTPAPSATMPKTSNLATLRKQLAAGAFDWNSGRD